MPDLATFATEGPCLCMTEGPDLPDVCVFATAGPGHFCDGRILLLCCRCGRLSCFFCGRGPCCLVEVHSVYYRALLCGRMS